MTTGEQLKRWREIQGWSQARLADELGVSQQAVSDWERGAKRMHGAAIRLVSVLGGPALERAEVAS